MAESDIYTPISVRVKLRKSQFSGETNKWKCTINGEDRIVTLRDVQWFCTSVEEASRSFVENEIESFVIGGTFVSDPWALSDNNPS